MAATLASFYRGDDGAPGADGADGVGVPIGGATGQVLAKASATDYDTAWVDQTGGGSFPSPTIPAFTDVTDAALETVIESNAVVVSGDADTVWPAVVRGDGAPEMQVNAGTWGASGIFRVGDSLKLRTTSAATGLVSHAVNLYAQGVASPWVVTTIEGFDVLGLFANGEIGVWYDPSDLTTLFQDTAGTIPVTAAGQTVALMLDKSGNALHATQATAAKRPVYQTDGTYHWLATDGVDDFMVAAYGVTFSELTRAVAYRANGADFIADDNNDVNEGSLYAIADGDLRFTIAGGGASNLIIASGGWTWGINSVAVASISAAKEMKLTGSGNDATPLTAASALTGLSGITVGGAAGGIIPLNGRIYGVVDINRVVTADERASVASYLAAQSGVILA